ncbi:MAG: DUF5666 domain-containing protein, partial [Dehalococcoidia bacterium]|nr:DUF5666 domain-containing protein [Dehalococcoidia bacterium]
MKITKFFLLFITVLSLLAGSVSAYRAPVSAQTLPVQIELRGTISGVVGDEITIAGQKVVRYPVTQVAGIIAAGATAKVDGALSADGSILARQITSPSDKLAEIQAFGNIVEITGAVGATTPTAITIMGKTMTIGAQTQVTGTVQVGAQAKLEGSFQPDGTILLRQVLSPPTVAIASAQPGTMKGLFGSVIAKGADSITINTAAEGTVNIKIDTTTRFRMPGRDAIGKDDLQVDDRLAILARKSTTDILTATDVMVVPGQPQNQHVVGAVTGIQGANVTITRPDGSKVTFEMTGTLPKLGGVLTVVSELDSKSGKMRSRSWQRVEQVEDRLVTRVKELEKEDPKGKAGEIEHLRGLVEDNAAHHLGILSEVRDRVEVEARGRMNETFEDARHSEDDMLRGLGMKGAQVETRGVISNINQANNKVTIQPQQGAAIELQVNAASRIHKDNNERAALADLKAGDTLLAVRFNPDSKELVRLVAKTPKVESVIGTVISSVNQSNKTFVIPHFLERTEPLVLSLNNDSRITRDGAPSTMDK